MDDDRPGYTDTPTLPGTEYGVHDPDRPRPPDVSPGPWSATGEPPSDATVLMADGDLTAWEAQYGGPAPWNPGDGFVEVKPGTGDIRTMESFGDCQLHLEWAAPRVGHGEGQQRGNSGVFLMDRYEIQILDNYDNPTYADGYAGAVYGQHPPRVNPCRPPGQWQEFDVVWRGPTFEDGAVVDPARLTLFHNGVLVQECVELLGATTHASVAEYEPHPPEAPLRLQEHGDRVRFRNVWYRPID